MNTITFTPSISILPRYSTFKYSIEGEIGKLKMNSYKKIHKEGPSKRAILNKQLEMIQQNLNPSAFRVIILEFTKVSCLVLLICYLNFVKFSQKTLKIIDKFPSLFLLLKSASVQYDKFPKRSRKSP